MVGTANTGSTYFEAVSRATNIKVSMVVVCVFRAEETCLTETIVELERRTRGRVTLGRERKNKRRRREEKIRDVMRNYTVRSR